jgi:O-antigen ligase
MVFQGDKGVDAQLPAESAKLRPILTTVAWHMFLDRPLVGCGFGQYATEMPAYLSQRTTDLPLEEAQAFAQHNVFLALLTETGLVGMMLFVALVACWTHAAWRLWRYGRPLWVRQVGLLMLGTIGAYLANGTFHDVSIVAMVNMFLFFLAGATMGLFAAGFGDAPQCAGVPRLRTFEPEPALA